MVVLVGCSPLKAVLRNFQLWFSNKLDETTFCLPCSILIGPTVVHGVKVPGDLTELDLVEEYELVNTKPPTLSKKLPSLPTVILDMRACL